MGYNTEPLVDHAVQPAWTSDERLWYRDTDAQGVRFVVFDPVKAQEGSRLRSCPPRRGSFPGGRANHRREKAAIP